MHMSRMVGGPAGSSGLDEPAVFPGTAGALEQDGQGQGAVPAEQQLPGAHPEDHVDQCGRGDFLRA
jgi:hypothetical protein